MKIYRFILLISALSYANNVNTEELKIGYFDLPPHITFNPQTNKIEGVLYDFLQNHIAPEMGDTFNFFHMPLARVLRNMELGLLDGGALFGNTVSRAKIHVYPKNHFYLMQSALVVNKNNTLNTITCINDLKKMTIAYILHGMLTPIITKNKIEMDFLSGLNPSDRNLKKLRLGRVDAVYSPAKNNLIYLTKKLGINNDIKILTLPEIPSKLYTVFAKASNTKNLAAKYDQAFKNVGGQALYKTMLLNKIGE